MDKLDKANQKSIIIFLFPIFVLGVIANIFSMNHIIFSVCLIGLIVLWMIFSRKPLDVWYKKQAKQYWKERYEKEFGECSTQWKERLEDWEREL